MYCEYGGQLSMKTVLTPACPANVQAGIILLEGQIMKFKKGHDNWCQDLTIADDITLPTQVAINELQMCALSIANACPHHATSWLVTSVVYWKLTKMHRGFVSAWWLRPFDSPKNFSKSTGEVGDFESEWTLFPLLLLMSLFEAVVIRSPVLAVAATPGTWWWTTGVRGAVYAQRSPIKPCWLVRLLIQLICPGRGQERAGRYRKKNIDIKKSSWLLSINIYKRFQICILNCRMFYAIT